LSLTDKGLIDGTISTIVTIVGGLLGGAFVSRFGLKKTLFVLALTVNVPNVCFVYLSQVVSADNPVSFTTVAVLASIEKFGYGFGFVGNMLYMMQQIAPGKYRMTHYAFATALMNLVLVPTQMASGPLADWLGYRSFFIFVMVATIPSLIAAWFAPFPNDPGGGVEESEEDSVELDADALAAQA
jgi:PAT family beta-lactamase induction signal transducer AmpG